MVVQWGRYHAVWQLLSMKLKTNMSQRKFSPAWSDQHCWGLKASKTLGSIYRHTSMHSLCLRINSTHSLNLDDNI